MVLMLEKCLRGGVSQCCNRYGKANYTYMKNYDNTKESIYLMYLDANNLYGWAHNYIVNTYLMVNLNGVMNINKMF